MRKLLVTIVLVASVAGCATANQRLQNSFHIKNGMTKAEVLRVMEGNPVANEFYGDLEEWHYCDTGPVHKYVAVFFDKDRVFAMKPYSVVESDEDLIFSRCEQLVKRGDYKEPDVVREYRIKYR